MSNLTYDAGRREFQSDGEAARAAFDALAELHSAGAQTQERGWNEHGSSGMAYPESCDLLGGATDCMPAAVQKDTQQVEAEFNPGLSLPLG